MIESEDLFKFLRREYKLPSYKKKENIKAKIKHIHDMNEYLQDFDTKKTIFEVETGKEITISNRLEASDYIEENIDYLTTNKTLKYKLA